MYQFVEAWIHGCCRYLAFIVYHLIQAQKVSKEIDALRKEARSRKPKRDRVECDQLEERASAVSIFTRSPASNSACDTDHLMPGLLVLFCY